MRFTTVLGAAAETLTTRREIAVRRAADARTTADTDAAIAAGRWDTAEADARAAISEVQTYDKETPLTLALAQSRLAHVLMQLHRRSEAAPLFAAAMLVIDRDMEPGHPVYLLAEQR